MQGDLYASSEISKGSVFTFVVPKIKGQTNELEVFDTNNLFEVPVLPPLST
jgi:hypothetical protein